MNHLVYSVFCLASISLCMAADWPQWRGPSLNGVSDETALPDALNTESLLWKAPLPGPSAATPVIADGCIYLTAGRKNDPNVTALCLSAIDGTQKWGVTLFTKGPNPGQNDVVSCSPVAYDGGAVFLFGEGTLLRLDAQGRRRWKLNLVEQYGPLTHKFGFSSSPLLYDQKLYIPVLRQLPEGRSEPLMSYLLCVDAESGRVLFRHDRPTDAVEEGRDAYTTPLTANVSGQTQIIVYGGDYLTAHAPDDGRELWRYGYGPEHNSIARLISSPAISGNIVVCVAPRGAKTFAVDIEKITDGAPALLWTQTIKGPDVPSPVCYRGCAYIIDEYRKSLTCLSLSDGALCWTGQLDKSDLYYASITAADGKLYMVNRKGAVTVAAADPREFRILSTSFFKESPVDSTLAIAGGKVYLRTAENLYCFGKKE
jgi:outer membrane protein assembly factor BamB